MTSFTDRLNAKVCMKQPRELLATKLNFFALDCCLSIRALVSP